MYILGGSGGVVNSLDFCPASLKSLCCIYFRCILSLQWKAVTVTLRISQCQLLRHFWKPVVRMCMATSNNLLLVLWDAPKRIFFLRTGDLLISPKTTQRHFFFPPSIPFPRYFLQLQQYWHLYCFAILSNFTQREAMPIQKSARKCAATSRDLLRERLQRAFTLANQIR